MKRFQSLDTGEQMRTEVCVWPGLLSKEEEVFISLGCHGPWKDFDFYLKSSRKLPQHSK